MTWTYTGPTTSERDEVRYIVQDTNCDEQLLQDNEIDYELLKNSTVDRAALSAAEKIARFFGRQATVRDAGFSVDYAARAKWYWELVKDLRSQGVGIAPYVGGISRDDKHSQEADTDRVEPAFTRDQFDHHGDHRDHHHESSHT